jgi:hypothetical protein
MAQNSVAKGSVKMASPKPFRPRKKVAWKGVPNSMHMKGKSPFLTQSLNHSSRS